MVGYCGEGVGDGGRNCAGTFGGVQGSCTDVVAQQELYLGSYGCDAEVAAGVPQ